MDFVVNYEKLKKTVDKLKQKREKSLGDHLLIKTSEDKLREGEEIYKMYKDTIEQAKYIDEMIKKEAREKRRQRFIEENHKK